MLTNDVRRGNIFSWVASSDRSQMTRGETTTSVDLIR